MPFVRAKRTVTDDIVDNVMNSHPGLRQAHEILRRPAPTDEERISRILAGSKSSFFDLAEKHIQTVENELREEVDKNISQAAKVSPDLSEKVEEAAPAQEQASVSGSSSYRLGATSFSYTANTVPSYATNFANAFRDVSQGMADSGARQEMMAERMPLAAKSRVFGGLGNIKSFAKKMVARTQAASQMVRDTMFKVSLRATTVLSSPIASKLKTASLGFGVGVMALTGLHHAIPGLVHHVGTLHSAGVTDLAMTTPPHPTGIHEAYYRMGAKAFSAPDSFSLASERINDLTTGATNDLHNAIARAYEGGHHLMSGSSLAYAKVDQVAHSMLHSPHGVHYASLQSPVHLATPAPVHAAPVAPLDVHLATPSPVHLAKVAPLDVHLATPAPVHAAPLAPEVPLVDANAVHPVQLAPHGDVHFASATAPAHAPHHHAHAHAPTHAHHDDGHTGTEIDNTSSLFLAEHGIDPIKVHADGTTSLATTNDVLHEIHDKTGIDVSRLLTPEHANVEHASVAVAEPTVHHHEAHALHHASLETHEDAAKNLHTLAKTDENGISGHAVVNGQHVSGDKDFNMHFVGRGVHAVERGVDDASAAVNKGLNRAANFLGL